MNIDTATALEAVQKLCHFLDPSAKAINGADGSHHSHASDSEMDDDVSQLFAAPATIKHNGVDVEIAFLRAPVAHRVPLYFVLPHEVNTGSICLITPPPQRTYKNKVLTLTDEKNDAVAARVARVMDSRKLNAKVSDPVTTRAFVKSFDNFVVYGVRKYPHQLTGEFIGHHRLPVWVARKGSFETSLHNAVNTVVVPRRGQNAVTCHVGHTGLTPSQLADNVLAFVQKFTHHHQGVPMSHVFRFPLSATSTKEGEDNTVNSRDENASRDGDTEGSNVSREADSSVARNGGAAHKSTGRVKSSSHKRSASSTAPIVKKRARIGAA